MWCCTQYILAESVFPGSTKDARVGNACYLRVLLTSILSSLGVGDILHQRNDVLLDWLSTINIFASSSSITSSHCHL